MGPASQSCSPATAVLKDIHLISDAKNRLGDCGRPVGCCSVGDVPSVRLFGVALSCVTMLEAVEQALAWIESSDETRCRYIVTPNVNHAVLLSSRSDLVEAYHGASLVLTDGWPLVMTSHLAGVPLPERVTGSDFVPRLFDESTRLPSNLRVFLLGAADGVGAVAAERIKERWPHVEIVGICSPPIGFERSELESCRLEHTINEVEPDLLVVGLGAPKQELWLHAESHRLRFKLAVAAGATIDFLAGRQVRAPRWIQRLCLEWLFRIATDPRRLAGRYLRDAIQYPSLAAREIIRSRLRLYRGGQRHLEGPGEGKSVEVNAKLSPELSSDKDANFVIIPDAVSQNDNSGPV